MEEINFLILTILVELPVAFILLRKQDWRQVGLVVLGVNLISHPIIWQAIYYYHADWFLAEICVAIFEGLVFLLIFRKNRLRAVCTGIIMNIVSASIGFLF